MCGNLWRLPCELPKLETASGWRLVEASLKTSRRRSEWKCVREDAVYVMDVQFDDETVDVITRDSRPGCNVWPKGRRAEDTSKLLPKKAWGRAGCRERHAHRVPRAEAISFLLCSSELEFSQAKMSRA